MFLSNSPFAHNHQGSPIQIRRVSLCWFRRAWHFLAFLENTSRSSDPQNLKTLGTSLQFPRLGGWQTPTQPLRCIDQDTLSCYLKVSLAFQRAGGLTRYVRAHTPTPTHTPLPNWSLPSQALPHFPSAFSHLLCAKLQHSQRSPTAATNPVLGSRSAVKEPQLV